MLRSHIFPYHAPYAKKYASCVSPILLKSIQKDLVFLAYQGYLKEQGIPSNGAFVNSVRQGDISAKDLVQSAIQLGRLSPNTINNLF